MSTQSAACRESAGHLGDPAYQGSPAVSPAVSRRPLVGAGCQAHPGALVCLACPGCRIASSLAVFGSFRTPSETQNPKGISGRSETRRVPLDALAVAARFSLECMPPSRSACRKSTLDVSYLAASIPPPFVPHLHLHSPDLAVVESLSGDHCTWDGTTFSSGSR